MMWRNISSSNSQPFNPKEAPREQAPVSAWGWLIRLWYVGVPEGDFLWRLGSQKQQRLVLSIVLSNSNAIRVGS